MRVRLKLAVAVGCSLMAVNASRAALSYLNIGYYGDYGVTVYAQGYGHGTYATAFSADWQSGTRNNSGVVGSGSGYVTSEPLPTGHSDPFVTFCLDINTILGNGWWQSANFSEVSNLGTAVDTVPPIDPNNPTTPAVRNVASGLNSAANLYSHYAGGILNANGNWANKAQGAALQLAIWEVLYETTKDSLGNYVYNVNSGSGFYVSSGDAGIRNAANAMLNTWGAPDYNIDTTFWNAVYNNGTQRSSQDLIGPMTPVPEPTTMIAGALLLLPFGASTLRILRRSRVA
jgi:hypothetical protein